jgi:hypothetical protein
VSDATPCPLRNVRMIQVIATETAIGSGAPNDPIRPLRQYWTLKGEFLAEFDLAYDVDRQVVGP